MFRLAIFSLLFFACSETQLQDGGSDATADSGFDSGAPKDTGARDADPIDADPVDADPIDADPMDADPVDADPIDAEPSDGGRNCAAIEADYQALATRTGCQDMQQCQVVNGHCGVGLGGCWYTVNVSVVQADLDMLAAEFTALGCTGGVCRCTAPPNMAICDQNVCMPAP